MELAEKRSRTLMVDHTFLYTGAVRRMKRMVETGEIGDLLYYDSVRVNLGLVQSDTNVLWDLAPHDFSIMDHLFGKEPVAVSAIGVRHLDCPFENVAYVTVRFACNFIAHFHVNWLAPVKIRMTLVGGTKKNDRLRRHGAQREDQSLRPRHHCESRSGGTDAHARRLPHRRHAGSEP